MRFLFLSIFSCLLFGCCSRSYKGDGVPVLGNSAHAERTPEPNREYLITKTLDDQRLTLFVYSKNNDDSWYTKQYKVNVPPVDKNISGDYTKKCTIVSRCKDKILICFSRGWHYSGNDKQDVLVTDSRVLTIDSDINIVSSERENGTFVNEICGFKDCWLVGRKVNTDKLRLSIDRYSYSEPFMPENLWVSDRLDASEKAIDAIVFNSNTIVAIDNVISPKYAITMTYDSDHIHKANLHSIPSGTNAHYYAAAIDNNRIVTLEHFSLRNGSGHELRRLRLESECIKEAAPSVMEYISYRNKNKGGDNYTSWFDVELIGNFILVSAGKRGLLTMPHDKHTAIPSFTDVGGSCLDITQLDGVTYILVKSEALCWVSSVELKNGKPVVTKVMDVEMSDSFVD